MTYYANLLYGRQTGCRKTAIEELPRPNIFGTFYLQRRQKDSIQLVFMRSVLLVLFLSQCMVQLSIAAAEAPVVVESVQASPAAVMPGTYPDIVGNIKMQAFDKSIASRPISIVAVLTDPEHRTKSWVWKNVVLAPGAHKSYPLPKDYNTKLIGEYRVEFAVYSSDMKRRFSVSSKKFTVAEKPQDIKKPDRKAETAVVTAPASRKPAYTLGVGAYANAINPAGGATMLIWPNKFLGVQASYTVGTFTSYEARLLGKMMTASGWNPYLGVGYLSVSTKTDVIGVSTTFTDSSVSGVVGIEIPISKRLFGYVEVTGASIDLKKIVTSGGRTVEATVEYAPISIGAGIVFTLF